MELKRLITRFAYRIEPKPEGGFIARASDPAVPPLEAPTRQELQQKIQQNILQGLADEFPGLKLPPAGKKLEFAFHVEHSPEGGFAIHSADPSVGVIKTNSQEEFQNRFLEKLLNFVGKHFSPELSQALAQASSGNIKVVVNRSTAFTANAGSPKFHLGAANFLPLGVSTQRKDAAEALPLDSARTTDPGSTAGAIGSSPILPEKSNFGSILRILLPLLLLAAMIYFLLHRY